MRKEVHHFDELKIPETALAASAKKAVQLCVCCNSTYVRAYFLITIGKPVALLIRLPTSPGFTFARAMRPFDDDSGENAKQY